MTMRLNLPGSSVQATKTEAYYFVNAVGNHIFC